jgi:Protein of unknown function (DUF1194)
MIRDLRFVGPWLIALFLMTPIVTARAAGSVDLLLAFAVDVSRSIDAAKFKLQRDGYVAAINNPRVIDAIRSGRNGRIAVCFIEWSGAASQKLVVDWTMINNAESARRFSDGLVEAPRSFADRTSISAGIDFAVQQLERTRSKRHGGQSTCLAMEPTTADATSRWRATRPLPKGSPSMDWSY